MSQLNGARSPLDDPKIKDFLTNLLTKGTSAARAAAALNEAFDLETSESSVKRFIKRYGLREFIPNSQKQPYTKINGDHAEGRTAPTQDSELPPPREMLKQRGLDPDEWEIEYITANEWGEEDRINYQTKFTARRKKPLAGVLPARSDGWRPPKTDRVKIPNWKTQPRLVVIVGDVQAPFQNDHLHELFCRWLEDNRPDEGVLLGDTMDFPDISRYNPDPENDAAVNECIQAAYDVLRGYVQASLDTKWQKLIGNHDQRLRDYVIQRAPALYGVARADEDLPVLSPSYLLRLDELGIETIDCHGTYEDAQVKLSPHLAVRHGWIAVKGSGSSALRTLEHLGHSVVIGHSHRQSLVYKTTFDIDGTPSTLAAAEAGCMCRIDKQIVRGKKFPGYTVNPNWQNGFCTALVWPNGQFRLDHATYAGNALYWQDQRYS